MATGLLHAVNTKSAKREPNRSESVADVSDVVEEIGKAKGGFYDVSRVVASDGRRWIAMPWTIGGGLLTNRRSWFAEVGYNDGRFPETWEEYRAAGKKLKAQGRPFGQTLGHTFGDAPVFWYPYLWSWGGKEVETDGKTVALNSKETLESVKFGVAFWNDCYDPGGLAWDDSTPGQRSRKIGHRIDAVVERPDQGEDAGEPGQSPNDAARIPPGRT